MVSSWCTTAYIAYSNEHMPAEDDPLALFDKIYDKPWTRLGPYLVGMAVGWILFKTDCKIRMSKVRLQARLSGRRTAAKRPRLEKKFKLLPSY